MLKKLVLLALMTALAAPAFAVAIRGSVGNISSTDAAALGTTGGLSYRIYSVSGSEAGFNVGVTVAGCPNARCPVNYSTLGGFGAPGGYLGPNDNTLSYNNDADNQIFYALSDGQVNAGACNHAAFYAVQGMVASSTSTTAQAGDTRQGGCAGTTSGNCMIRADSANADPTPVLNVNMGYQDAHSIASVGGLSPVPAVRVNMSATNGCPAGQAKLTWDEPELYAGAMKLGATSPVKGVRLWKSASACSACPSGDIAAGGWAPVGFFAHGQGSTGTCQGVSGDAWYALTVVLKGPSNNAAIEMDSGVVGGNGFVGANSQCVNTSATAARLTSVNARYAGRGSVNVKFTSGTEAGVTGFYVQRASSASGPWTRVSELIAAKGDGSEYASTEKVRAGLGNVVYYSVQVVMNDGSTIDSGATAVTLPSTQKKLNPGQ